MRKGQTRVTEDEGRAIRHRVLTKRATRTYLIEKMLDIFIFSVGGACVGIGLLRLFGNL